MKKKMSSGLAFGESEEMEMLRRESQKGNHVKDLRALSYYFEEGEPADYIYKLDFQDKPESDYFEMFEAAGWELAASQGTLYIFRAPPGTTPIYSDTETKKDFYRTQTKSFAKYTVFTGVPFLLSLIFLNEYTSWIPALISMLLVIPFVFCAYPLLGFYLSYRVGEDTALRKTLMRSVHFTLILLAAGFILFLLFAS